MTQEQKATINQLGEKCEEMGIRSAVLEPTKEQSNRIVSACGFPVRDCEQLVRMSVWGGLYFEILPNGYQGYGYNRIEYRFSDIYKERNVIEYKGRETIQMPITEEVANVCVSVINELIAKRKEEISETMKNAPLESIENEILEHINAHIEENYPKAKAVFSVGKRGCDTSRKPYKAIVFETKKNDEYLGMIELGQNRFGGYYYTCAVPLNGEFNGTFTYDTYKEEMEQLTKHVLGRYKL